MRTTLGDRALGARATTHERGFGVTIRFWAAESCVSRDTNFCVVIVALQCETGVCNDRVGCVEVQFCVMT